MRVYIITTGEYSCYRILEIAESYEEAQIKAMKWVVERDESYDMPNIEVWDSEQGELDGARHGTWDICVNYDGTVECVPVEEPRSFEAENNGNWRTAIIEYCFHGIRAVDEEHARKIGYDMLAEVKAAAAGIWWIRPENREWVAEKRRAMYEEKSE